MVFTSLNFLVFFCLITVFYYCLPHRMRWILLLAGSLAFYLFAVPVYAIVLAGTILMNFFFGIWMDHSEKNSKRRQILVFGIVLNLLVLAVFRYADSLFGFVSSHFQFPQQGDPVLTRIIIPLGISFYTFTSISYLVELKRKNIPVEKHLGYFACYLSFFPKLIQGPIERPQHFLPQLREKHVFHYPGVTSGIRLMLWGYFKKLVIADQLSGIVNAVYDNKLSWHGPLLVAATLLYAFQIYMDFSGYIDIARGAARILGFNLSRNFNNPYLSKSVKEFWTRWHITLSQWLRDYIFLPLAYYLSDRMKKEKYAGVATEKYLYSIAITVTFLLCGLWHGVGWKFIAWGGVFAVYLVMGSLTGKPKKRFYRETGLLEYKTALNTLQVVITFLLVCFAWIFFRAADLETSVQVISHLFSGWGYDPVIEAFHSFRTIISRQGLTITEAGVVLLLVPCIEFIEYHFRNHRPGNVFLNLPLPVRWGAYYVLVFLICYFGKSETNTFIYFQF